MVFVDVALRLRLGRPRFNLLVHWHGTSETCFWKFLKLYRIVPERDIPLSNDDGARTDVSLRSHPVASQTCRNILLESGYSVHDVVYFVNE